MGNKMDYTKDKSYNWAKIIGTVKNKFVFDHKMNDDEFYRCDTSVYRNSGIEDIVIIVANKELINGINIGDKINVIGQLRSHDNKDGTSKLFIFSKNIELVYENIELNDIEISGYICKKPVIRNTPRGRIIANVVLAVNRAYGKTDYIPCILWEDNAKLISNYNIGDFVDCNGRLQSRYYNKDGNRKITHELSVDIIK